MFEHVALVHLENSNKLVVDTNSLEKVWSKLDRQMRYYMDLFDATDGCTAPK